MFESQDQLFNLFATIWIVLGIVSFLLFFVSNNAKLKKKLYAPFTIGAGLLFILFLYLIVPQPAVLIVAIPMVILITVMNLKTIKFCSQCGKTIMQKSVFSKAKHCPKCGVEMDD